MPHRHLPCQEQVLGAQAGAVNILIVDDEPRNLTVLESILADPEYRLVRATSGQDALLALMAEDFALLVLDVQMPGMTGFELAQLIKQRKRTAEIPIIFLTAYLHDDNHAIQGYSTGAVDYLAKPVNPSVLRSKVHVFAELHRRTERLVKEVEERRTAEARLIALNATLDQRVAERTSALAASEQSLRDVNDRKDEFLATLAHELRNPLAPIRNAAHIVKAKCANPGELEAPLAIIDRQVRAMGRLIEDLMDVSRINRGRFELRREVIDVHDAVRDAIEVVQPLVEDCGHSLLARTWPGPLLVDADRARLAQSLVNLLNNAAKYTERHGRIAITTELHDGAVVIRVRDSGIGIAPDRLRTIFDMFSQEEAAIQRSRGGLGIGLALTQRLIGMHGGTVAASSEGPGRGSEFEIRLPLAVSTSPVCRDDAPAPAASSSLRIVIADDNADAAETLGSLLEIMGHSVLRVDNGEAAVNAVAEFEPELVLLDIGMPKLNGYEACKRIRSLPGHRSMTIAALTGWGQAKDVAEATSAGFDRHMVKPIEMGALCSLVEQASVAAGARGRPVPPTAG